MKIAVLGSGSGSNFQAIVEYFKNKSVEIECISNKKDAYILKRAEKLNIPAFFVEHDDLYEFLRDKTYNLFVLAGYMRILPQNVLSLGTFINIHPSILPNYKGVGAIKRAYHNNDKEIGITIHYVSDDLDSGEIIEQIKFNVDEGCTLYELEEKIHQLEHYHYPRIIEKLLIKGDIE